MSLERQVRAKVGFSLISKNVTKNPVKKINFTRKIK